MDYVSSFKLINSVDCTLMYDIYPLSAATKIELAYQKYQAASTKEKEGALRKWKVDSARYLRR